MNWGVIAFIDALAVKGIWQRHDAEAVLTAFESVRILAEKMKEDINSSYGGDLWDKVSANVVYFSDSVAIGVNLPPPLYESENPEFYESTRKYMLLRHVVLFLSKLVGEATLGKVPLMYRGCISVGQFMMKGSSFIGEAVDKAGASFESCDGAFIYFSEEAADFFNNRHPYLRMGHPPYFVPYKIPMKTGEVLETITINPLLFLEDDDKPQAIDAFIREFGDVGSQSEPIQRKAENTIRYLEYLKGWQW